MDAKPALLTVVKKGHEKRVMFFDSHLDAFDAMDMFKADGWQWTLEVIEVYRQGEKPQLEQARLL